MILPEIVHVSHENIELTSFLQNIVLFRYLILNV